MSDVNVKVKTEVETTILKLVDGGKRLSETRNHVSLLAIDARVPGGGVALILGSFDPTLIDSPESCQKFLKDMLQQITETHEVMDKLEELVKQKAEAAPESPGETLH